MNLSTTRILVLVGVGALFLLLVWWLLNPRGVVSPGEEPGIGVDVPVETLCPLATPEFFAVEPVTSPTDQLSQVISVDLGNGETLTVTTESGTFTAPFDSFPEEIEIALLPDTIHNLTVEGRVREVTQGECVYGGYTLTTTFDRIGEPLVIEQRQP